jgi:hypothetical protein
MITLIIDPAGQGHCLYAEVIDLQAIGTLHIARASHLEPDDCGNWHADLSPVAGPTLGPFGLRSEALAAERDWLDDHLASVAATPRQISNVTTPS